ncbi:hypothetical protein HFP57_04305 [Parasphingopyxis algicola]|uniref:hypothetical protein n=1 Tax=Parasphingopyxis algicola TaxID=2026624 RepID=UPI0015A41429|nr:hypothetical protein [Parasphingopyxis algicola]QLC24324.1 hypothetical protein HFP57_04305 [Parasphingopyxis algicola]
MLLAANIALSIAMVSVFALGAGGIWLWVKRGEKQRGLLMLAAAIVILANVLIWTVPNPV